MSSVLENIKLLAANEGIAITKLEQKIGASKGVLSRAIAKGKDIQVKWIVKIVHNYPQYNCDWLIKNEGPMLKQIANPADLAESDLSLHYKDLADSRKETIESLKKEIVHLENKIVIYKNKDKSIPKKNP